MYGLILIIQFNVNFASNIDKYKAFKIYQDDAKISLPNYQYYFGVRQVINRRIYF